MSRIRVIWISIFMLGVASGLGISYLSGFSSAESLLNSGYLESQYPKAHIISEKEGYTVAFDGRTKNPLWVYEELSTESLSGHADRKKCRFKQDEEIPKHIQADLKDYQASGYDRGHLAPASDCSFSQDAIEATFLLSNISPQAKLFNRGYWKKLENHVRELVHVYGKLQVISGPLYLPSEDTDGIRSVHYPVIGPNDVGVPTHFFKLIRIGESDDLCEAYVLPNQALDSSLPLESFRVDVRNLEKASGILF